MPEKGQDKEFRMSKSQEVGSRIGDFVLDKVIFSNVFDKDIRRIYIYRKSERLAKAIQLITPAFANSPSLKNRLDGIAVGLIDAAILPPSSAREVLSRELLALSSILSVAKSGALLSDMNANLLTREAHLLLQEIADYQEPRIFMDDSLTLSELAKRTPDMRESTVATSPKTFFQGQSKGHLSDKASTRKQIAPQISTQAITTASSKPKQSSSTRQESILEILRTKGSSYIKDISMLIREVSEKTIQRELQALVEKGIVEKTGERRWTTYSIK
jgi:DNA-binding transcriptional ArsR family regulator